MQSIAAKATVIKMYTRSYQSDDGRSFRRGEYNIPANYKGNAFMADEVPHIDEAQPAERVDEEIKPRKADDMAESVETVCRTDGSKKPDKAREGILRSVISRFERGFEFDDLLLIGLILLMLHGEKRDGDKNNDEMILILALLFLIGF